MFFFKFHFKRKRRAAILFVRRERASLTIWASEGLGERRPLCGGIGARAVAVYLCCQSHQAGLAAGWPGAHAAARNSLPGPYLCHRQEVGGWGQLSEPTQRSIVLAAQSDRSARQTSLCSARLFNAQSSPHPLSPSSLSCIHPPPARGAGGVRGSMDSWPRPAVPRAFHRTHMHTCTHPPGPACQPGSRARAIFL